MVLIYKNVVLDFFDSLLSVSEILNDTYSYYIQVVADFISIVQLFSILYLSFCLLLDQ